MNRTIFVGDIHGQYDTFLALIEKLKFSDSDTLISCGDLVGKGSDSYKVISFFANTKNADCLLGNHEIRLIYRYLFGPDAYSFDLEDIFTKKNIESLIHWVKERSLFNFLEPNIFASHSGFSPFVLPEGKSLKDSLSYLNNRATSCMNKIKSLDKDFIQKLMLSKNYSNDSEEYFVRSFCNLNLINKYGVMSSEKSETFIPWFDYAIDRNVVGDCCVVFGHWSALLRKTPYDNIICIDGTAKKEVACLCVDGNNREIIAVPFV